MKEPGSEKQKGKTDVRLAGSADSFICYNWLLLEGTYYYRSIPGMERAAEGKRMSHSAVFLRF